ncbi:MAG: CDP-glucose 4,6-dehydratase [Formivibrio sp.]|nr:CDP-glucose 4,6-dehydratase [Formivibrio sp.]
MSTAGHMLGEKYSRFAGRRVFVTGHTGFKGSWLTFWLSQLGAQVSGYALAPTDDEALFTELGVADEIDHHVGDIRDLDTLRSALTSAEPEIVFHLAAQPLVRRSYDDPLETFTTNVTGGANLLEAVRHAPSVKALVFITSDKCYENKEWVWGYRETDELGGKDPYSASKAAAEIVFRSYGLSYFSQRKNFGYATTRAGNVIGGGDWSADRLVPDCIRALRGHKPIIIRNPRSTRPWQLVLEPLAGYMDLALQLLDDPKGFSGAWNFGPSGQNFLNVEQVASCIIQNWGSGAIRREIDPNAAHEANLLHLSIDKAVSQLGWRPRYTGLEATEITTKWYKRRTEGEGARAITLAQIRDFVAAMERA